MKSKTQNILRGVGSIMDIMPQRRALDLSKLMPRETPSDMMANAWKKVGKDIEQAMRQISSEQGNKKTAL